MSFLVIDRTAINKIFRDDDDLDIDMLEFKTEEEAKYYLEYGKIMSDNKDEIIVFTDGACSKNGGKNAIAGIGVYFGIDDKRNVSKKFDGKQSNNTAEMLAIIEVFNILDNEIKEGKKVIIYSDSKYSIGTFTQWAPSWEKNNWVKKSKGDIKNLDIVKKGYNLFKSSPNVSIEHVKGHSGQDDYLSKGNNEADLLAKKALI